MSQTSHATSPFRERHQYIAEYYRPSLVDRWRYRWQDRNRPIDFMVIGIAKCGTTWLSSRLDQIPEVQRSVPKEPHFFKFRWREKFEDWNVKKVRAIYLRRFWPHPRGKFLFEASPGYLSYPIIAHRIRKFYPATKFVVLLREPASRAYSHYNMWVRNGKIGIPFSDLVDEQLAIARTCLDHSGDEMENYYRLGIKRPQSMITFGLYYLHLKAWLEVFPRAQVHILTIRQLRDPLAIGRMLDFVGVGAGAVADMGLDTPSRKREEPPMGPEVRSALQAFYEPYNQRLYDLLGVRELEW
ncbi:MAG: sulfotransferase domain-containing protein [Saprospiraceae bacterium]|nr:sulfotransferase domain-containing protein [Saprospiraceae bacterium]